MQNIFTNLDNIVWRYTQDKAVIGCMMEFAKRNAIIYCGFAFWQIIWNDMRGIK